jgi:hypothetical protein
MSAIAIVVGALSLAVVLTALVRLLRKRKRVSEWKRLGEAFGESLAADSEQAWDAFKAEFAHIDNPSDENLAEIGKRFESWLETEVRPPLELAYGCDTPTSRADFEEIWKQVRFRWQTRLAMEYIYERSR